MRTLRAVPRRLTCAAAFLAATTTGASAQDAPPPVAARRDSLSYTPAPRWQFDQCMGGLTYGAPLKWALSYGMGWVRESEQRNWCFLGAGKVGFGGASFNVGIANSMGRFGSGVAFTGGVLRTFNDPMGAIAKRTYLGGNVHLWPILALGGEVGYYRRMGTDPVGLSTGRGMFVWSTGFGF